MAHPWHDIPLPPDDHLEIFPVVIEVPSGNKNKYELDKATGLLKVDRVLHSAVHYPANYGFVPRTYAEDDDPIDVLVLGQEPVVPLALVQARAIGGFRMRDEHGEDVKLIAVHVNDPAVSDYQSIDELPKHVVAEMMRFFEDYKVLEGKTVEVGARLDLSEARRALRQSVERYRAQEARLRSTAIATVIATAVTPT
jgi:inorganic pyrophosphatase